MATTASASKRTAVRTTATNPAQFTSEEGSVAREEWSSKENVREGDRKDCALELYFATARFSFSKWSLELELVVKETLTFKVALNFI